MRACFRLILGIVLPMQVFGQSITGRIVDPDIRDGVPHARITVGDKVYHSDVNGRFDILGQVPVQISIRTYGFRDTILALTRSGQVIVLEPVYKAFEEITITPGEDPAYRIIRNVLANESVNDPMNYRFRYSSYNKFFFSLELDSGSLGEDEAEVIAFLDTSYLFLTESIIDHYRKGPVNDKSFVRYQRTSGFENSTFSLAASEFQSFSFYGNEIELAGIKYVNPVSKQGLKKYDLELKDSILQGDSYIYTIEFNPLKKGNTLMRGVLEITSDGWAIKYVEARPFVSSSDGVDVRIRQLYEKTNDIWFPHELNTVIRTPFSLGGTMLASGKTQVDSVQINPSFEGVKFDHMDIEVKLDSTRSVTAYRDTLSKIEDNTYQNIDSLSKEANLEKMMSLFPALVNGRIPIGFVDFSLEHLMGFNDWEGFRLRGGLYTNDKISKWFSLGGYGAYGFKDKKGKYGGSFRLKFSEKHQFWSEFAYANDVRVFGSTNYELQKVDFTNTDAFLEFLQNRMDYVETYKAAISARVFRHFQVLVSGEHRLHQSPDVYTYDFLPSEEISFMSNDFRTTELSTELRFAFNEKFVDLFGVLLPTGYSGPEVLLKYIKALEAFDSPFSYSKLDANIRQYVKSRMGKTTITAKAGKLSGSAPLSIFYAIPASWKEFTVAVPTSFETMRLHEFYAGEYVMATIEHTFPAMYSRPLSAPSIALAFKSVYGSMHESARHQGYDYRVPHRGYHEAGFYINGILRSNFQGMGIGAAYRIGEYAFNDWRENIAFRFSLTFSLE